MNEISMFGGGAMTLWNSQKLNPYRAVVAVDARDFSSLDSEGMAVVNEDVLLLLSKAMTAVGLDTWEERYFGQHTGDGYVAGVDPEHLPALVSCLPRALNDVLRGHPRPDGRPLQLRLSVHVGPLPDSGVGEPMVETHRLLDDDRLRGLLSRATPALTPLAMIVSERAYEDVYRSGCATNGAGPKEFAHCLVRVKSFEKPAWIHVPGLDWALADPDLLLTEQRQAPNPASSEQAELRQPPVSKFNAKGNGTIVQTEHFTNHSINSYTGGDR
ncbi:hypothetical protein [Nocardiopsis alba]|uniref:hypothetical protein n=1 Tax=Nocardiopsis alba TaxID=53437 RepID=UPI0035DB00F2